MRESKQALSELRQIYDEVRVKMHLGEMEAKEWWEHMEPQMATIVDSMAREANKASDSAAVFVEEFSKALRRVRDRLNERN